MTVRDTGFKIFFDDAEQDAGIDSIYSRCGPRAPFRTHTKGSLMKKNGGSHVPCSTLNR